MKKLPALPACLFLAGILPGADLPVKPTAGGHLPGELSAEQILNGEYPWPPSPVVSTRQVGPDKGFDPDAFRTVPAAGIHPRILFSPEDLPAIRKQMRETEAGRTRVRIDRGDDLVVETQ